MLGFPAPADMRRRALFYSQLATLLEAGHPMVASLGTLGGTHDVTAEHRLARSLLEALHTGATVAESFAGLPRPLSSPLEIAMVRSGEQSGRLDRAFALISRHHAAAAENIASMMGASVYPLLVLHVTAFVAPLPSLVRTGNVPAYLARSLGVLLSLYLLAALIAWACRPGHPWHARTERFLLRVPVLGPARAELALSRLAWSMESLLSAGVLVTEAWPLSARASGSARIEQTVEEWREPLASGATPAELVSASGVFPDEFVGSYATGETTGRLEQELRRLARRHEEEGFRKMRWFAAWCPKILYGLVSAWVVLEIISVATGYMTALGGLLDE
jgi:type II secretory pathway component PulF